MPWALSTVYLRDTPDARAVLLADTRLTRRIYAVDLAVVPFPPLAGGPLLAVRAPVRTTDLAEVVDGFDWKRLDGLLATQLGYARPHLGGLASRLAPPDGPLRWLEDLAARVAAPVVWYQARAVASDPDAELAWVLDWGGPTEVDGEAFIRAPVVYVRRDGKMLRVGSGGVEAVAREPLGAGLLHLGLRLDGPWFTPHRPDFEWGACRIG